MAYYSIYRQNSDTTELPYDAVTLAEAKAWAEGMNKLTGHHYFIVEHRSVWSTSTIGDLEETK